MIDLEDWHLLSRPPNVPPVTDKRIDFFSHFSSAYYCLEQSCVGMLIVHVHAEIAVFGSDCTWEGFSLKTSLSPPWVSRGMLRVNK